MKETQSFRLTGTVEVEKIPIQHVSGENFIFWDDIEQVFPRVQYIKNAGTITAMVKDCNGTRAIPYRIKHYPGVILDVVLSTDAKYARFDSPMTPPTLTGVDAPTNDRVESLIDVLTTNECTEASQDACPHSDMPISNIRFSTLSTTLQSSRSISPSSDQTASNAGMSFRRIVKLASTRAKESNGHVESYEGLCSGVNEIKAELANITALTVQNIEQASRIIQLQEALNSKQDEMKQLQAKALSKLAVLQARVQAVFTQTYELHEYPIPRLFIVLPQDSSRWDILEPFSSKFRLYFLCECGEHTKSNNSKIPHHIHLAKHDGYDISRPSEFFQLYGFYVLTILKMLKFGISVAGIALPAISHLIRADVIDQATAKFQQLRDNIQPGMDQVIGYIESVSENEDKAIDVMNQELEGKEALEGADLRKLNTFLKDKDGNKALGNLYRTVTVEGHVKWVCIDHYRENYQATAAKAFQGMVDSLEGSFDERIGRAEVDLRSRIHAERFYLALEKAKSIYELKVTLSWETTYGDFKKLRDTLQRTCIGVLEFDYTGAGPASDIMNRNRRYDPILGIMRHPSIQSFTMTDVHKDFLSRSSPLPDEADFSNLKSLAIGHLDSDIDYVKLKSLVFQAPNLSRLSLKTYSKFFEGPKPWPSNIDFSRLRQLRIQVHQAVDTLNLDLSDAETLSLSVSKDFFDRYSPWPTNADFSNLMCLEFHGLHSGADIAYLKRLASQAQNLAGLVLETSAEQLPAVYSAVAVYQAYPIDIRNLSLRFLPQPSKSRPSTTVFQDLAHLFKFHGAQIEKLDLDVLKLDESAMRALAEATKNGSSLKQITLTQASQDLGDRFIKDLAGTVAKSQLDKLTISLGTEVARMSILESVQWGHIRELDVILPEADRRTGTTRALVDDMKIISERVQQGYLTFNVRYAAIPGTRTVIKTSTVNGVTVIKTSTVNGVTTVVTTVTAPGQPTRITTTTTTRVPAGQQPPSTQRFPSQPQQPRPQPVQQLPQPQHLPMRRSGFFSALAKAQPQLSGNKAG
ncbi:hypothetical protein EDD21DRAFT_222672 [Dissophora ornata]|nr:hypothetical protein EDD21DRAFT_222672 [Dissophora ornata]